MKTKKNASKLINDWLKHQKSGARVRPHKKRKSGDADAGVATLPGDAATTVAAAVLLALLLALLLELR